MFFLTKTLKAGASNVFFGFELTGICPLEVPRSIHEALLSYSRLVRALFTPALDLAFELVAVSRPAGGSAPSLSLRVRVSHHNSAKALAAAQQVADGLAAALALMERLQWVPLDETRFKQLYEGFNASDIWEISRRSQLIEVAKQNVATASDRFGLAVFPLLPQPDPIAHILRILNQCKEAVRLTVAIAPTRFSERELKFLAAQRKAAFKDSDDEEVSDLTPSGSMALLGTTSRADFMKDSSFLLRIYVASVETLPECTVNSFGCALAAPAVPSEYSGGFQIHHLAEPEEKRVADGNLENLRFVLPAFQAGTPWGRLPMIVPVMEAAAVFRFPSSPCPGIERVRRAAPFTGKTVAVGTLIGTASGSGADRTEVRLSPEARLRHVYICGQTGVGKTTFMYATAMQDIEEDNGLCLLDPHGDLFAKVRDSVPARRRKDVIIFDCSAADPGFCFNLLEHSNDGERDRIVEHFLEMFGQLFDLRATGGPIFEMYFRAALTLVMCDPQATLADFMKFFFDRDYRVKCISLCKDSFVSSAWEKIAATAGGEMSLANVAPYIVSKLSPFLFNRQTRSIVSCQKSTLSFDQALRSRKIILVNLAKGTIGNLAASFIGMLFTEKILRAAMNPANRKNAGGNFYLYADEFQNIATPGFSELLSEARKHKLGAVLAHQFLGQLPPQVLRAALGNSGNLLCFRVGPEDSHLLSEYFLPTFSKSDLLNLPVGAAAASILADGEKPYPFLLSTPNVVAVPAAAPACQEHERADVKPAVSARKPARRLRAKLRPINSEPKEESL